MSDRKLIGRAAEDQAADFLLSLGYTLVTRRFKARHGEIDLICLDGEELVFIEVKVRRAPGYVPEEAIGEAKLRSLQRAATEYVSAMDEKREVRFDVVAIDREGLRYHRDVLGHRLT
ncbi:MAG TPA: YraN family protein [Fimbriimonas sp.]|nr:YraN family protein [Fimbriimonas sp.]